MISISTAAKDTIYWLQPSEHLDKSLKRYRWDSKYKDVRGLEHLLNLVDHSTKVKLLGRHETLEKAASRSDSTIINTILSTIPPDQRLAVLIRNKSTPLHRAAFWGELESVEAILSHLTPEQQLKLLSARNSMGYTPAERASIGTTTEREHIPKAEHDFCDGK